MRAMKTLSTVFLACSLLTALGCQNDSKLDKGGTVSTSGGGDLESRIKKLEADQAKHAEALDFLDKVYSQQKQQADQQEREEAAPDAVFAVDIASDLAAGQVEGPANAPVTIVEAFDFACPYCRQVSTTLESLVKSYNGKVRVVFKNMVVHPQIATTAHLASCAAAKQGKYPVFKNALWDKAYDPYAAARDPSKLGEDNILAIAKDVGLNVDKLKTDMKSDECKKSLDADMAELAKFHVNSTPTLFVNGMHVGGALPEAQFKVMIDEKIKAVEASGVAPADYYDKEVMGKGEKQFRSKKDPKPS
jgi:protein-disulfide isomerase